MRFSDVLHDFAEKLEQIFPDIPIFYEYADSQIEGDFIVYTMQLETLGDDLTGGSLQYLPRLDYRTDDKSFIPDIISELQEMDSYRLQSANTVTELTDDKMPIYRVSVIFSGVLD